MSRQSAKQRGQVISQLGSMGVNYETACKLLRYGATLQRLAEAQCNGDWPADNGEGKCVECDNCQGLWVSSSMFHGHKCEGCHGARAQFDRTAISLLGTTTCPKCNGTGKSRMCPDCRTMELATAAAQAAGLTPSFQGDPRGGVFMVTKDGREVCIA